MKLSAIMEVYNEARCLPCSLAGLLPAVDECIIIDGSEKGISTDGTKKVIERFAKLYPDKMVYLAGRYERDDGAWDDTAQSNAGFERMTGEFVMRTHADLVYDTDDIWMIRNIIDRYPDKKYFYCPHLEFYCDTDHILLASYIAMETCLPRHPCGDVAVIAVAANPHFVDSGKYKRSHLVASIDWQKDIIFMPHVKRFHYAYVKPFKEQVEKVVRYILRGDYEGFGSSLMQDGIEAVYDYAVKQVKGYAGNPRCYPYAGLYPEAGEPLRGMNIMDGYDEFIRSKSGTDTGLDDARRTQVAV